MSEDIKSLTLKRYLDDIKMRLEAQKQSDRARALFEHNRHNINDSLEENLRHYDALVQTEVERYQHELNERKKTFEGTIKGTHDKFLAAQQEAEHKLQEVKAQSKQVYLEADQEAQQLQITYDGTYETLNQAQVNDIKKIEEALQAFAKEHETLQAELGETTKANQEKIKLAMVDAKAAFDEDYEKLAREADDDKTEITIKIQELLVAFEEVVEALEKDFEKKKQPFIKERQAIDRQHEKEKEAIQKQYSQALSKKDQYAKEADKIGDVEAKQSYQREIKQINKELQDALNEENDRYEAELRPFLDKEKAFMSEQNALFYTQKMEHIEKLIGLKKALQKTKTTEMLDLDELNTQFTLAEKTSQTEQEFNRLDHTVQALNYDQRKFEQTLLKENEKALLGPAFDIDVLTAKENVDQGFNDLERNRQKATLEEDDAQLAYEHWRSYESQHKAIQLKTLEAYYAYDKIMLEYEHARHLTQALHTREAMIISHYLYASKNYTALKAQTFTPYEASLFKTLEGKRDDAVDFYHERIEEARREHAYMVSHIEETHALEIEPLMVRIKQFNKRRQDALKKEENGFQKRISGLSMQGKDKRKNQRLLEQMQQEHKRAIEHLNAQFDQEQAPLNQLKNAIDQAKKQSLEEAETLMNHTIDAAEASLNTVESLIEQEKQFIAQTDETLKKRSGLFEMFQQQRHDAMLTNIEMYQKADLEALEILANQAEATLYEQLNQFDKQEATHLQKYNQQTEKRKADYQQRQTTIIEDHATYSKQLAQETAESKRRASLNAAQLKRQYDQNLHSLTDQINAERQKYFTEKERFERHLNKERERLEDQFDKERDRKQERLDAYDEQLQNQKLQIALALEDDAIDTLKATDVTFVSGVLEDTLSITELKH